MGEMVPFEGQKLATAFAAVANKQEESLSDGIGTGYPVISYKGAKWALKQGGETKMFLREDGSPTDTLHVVILRASPTKSKSFFKKFDPDNPGVRPVCWSMDAITPADDVPAKDKQANACALCPKNKSYQNAEGRRVRDCSDFKRLSVMILPKQSEALLGKPLLEPVFLRIPASSLTNLAKFGDDMGPKGKGFPYYAYVTKITFDPESPFPKMTFGTMKDSKGRATGLLTNAEAPLILELRESPVSYRITGESPDTEIHEAEAEMEVSEGIGLVEAKAAQQEVIPPEPRTAEKLQGLGFAGADLEAALDAVEVEQPKTEAKAVQQTTADTGVAEADEELLARINKMLKK